MVRDKMLQFDQQIVLDIGVGILVDRHPRRGMRAVNMADTAGKSRRDPCIDLLRNVEQFARTMCLNKKFRHAVTLSGKPLHIPDCLSAL